MVSKCRGPIVGLCFGQETYPVTDALDEGAEDDDDDRLQGAIFQTIPNPTNWPSGCWTVVPWDPEPLEDNLDCHQSCVMFIYIYSQQLSSLLPRRPSRAAPHRTKPSTSPPPNSVAQRRAPSFFDASTLEPLAVVNGRLGWSCLGVRWSCLRVRGDGRFGAAPTCGDGLKMSTGARPFGARQQ